MRERTLGFVGAGEDKFTPEQAAMVKRAMRLFAQDFDRITSGHSPLGGVDIWAEEIAAELGKDVLVFAPKQQKWDAPFGYKQRNLAIANAADTLIVIVSSNYPPDYKGRRFQSCYHCKSDRPFHVKSGGCWTGIKAKELGKDVDWLII